MKSKPRLDQPHLEPLRYDYQLLHDCYARRNDRNPVVTFALFVFGLALWVAGVFAVAVLMGVTP